MQSSESREDRLVRVVQKLEAKVKTIWDEKKALEERLELATLDKELAEERYLAEKAAVRSTSEAKIALEARVAELEELQALSVELEESYIAQKEELSTVIAGLKKDLLAASEKAERDAQAAESRITELLASQTSEQSVEALRQKLESTKLQLAACKMDLAARERGIAGAIEPIFAQSLPECVDILPFIDYYELAEALRGVFDSFRVGDLSARKFAQAIEAEISKAEADPKRPRPSWASFFDLLKGVKRVSSHLQNAISSILAEPLPPNIQALLENLKTEVDSGTAAQLEHEVNQAEVQKTAAEVQPKAEASHNTEPSSSQELETLRLRVRFLESKLSQAKELAAEIDTLKKWQSEARSREARLQKLLNESEENANLKSREIAQLKRAELPTTLDAAVVQQKLKGMATALQWFSRTKHESLSLDSLITTAPTRVSILTGNPRVSAMRKAIQGFSLVEVDTRRARPSKTNGAAAATALDQFETLAKLGCIAL